jgi:hypothetical protein
MSANQPPENNPQQGGNPQNVPGATPEQGVRPTRRESCW